MARRSRSRALQILRASDTDTGAAKCAARRSECLDRTRLLSDQQNLRSRCAGKTSFDSRTVFCAGVGSGARKLFKLVSGSLAADLAHEILGAGGKGFAEPRIADFASL